MPAKRKPVPVTTDAEIFTQIGRALFEGDDWPSRFGAALDLPKQTVRDIRRDHADISPKIAASMRIMIENRATEVLLAREALKAWLKHQRV